MGTREIDPREDIDRLILIATHSDYMVTEKQMSDGRISLDITRNAEVYQLSAVFGQGDSSTFWSYDVGYDHRDGGAVEVLLMERLINLIKVR